MFLVTLDVAVGTQHKQLFVDIQHVSLDTHVLVIFKLIAVSDTLVLLSTETIRAEFLAYLSLKQL